MDTDVDEYGWEYFKLHTILGGVIGLHWCKILQAFIWCFLYWKYCPPVHIALPATAGTLLLIYTAGFCSRSRGEHIKFRKRSSRK